MGRCRVRGPLCAETNPDDEDFPPGMGFEEPPVTGLDTTGSGTSTPGTLTGWPRSLSWSEFTERDSRPEGGDENAQIHSEVRLSPRVSVQPDGGNVRLGSFTVEVVTISEDCWVVRGTATAALLAHEQGHFDITGLMGRDTMADLTALRSRSSRELQREVTAILERYRERARSLTDRYDTETNHARNTEAQTRWERSIRDAIQNNTRLT